MPTPVAQRQTLMPSELTCSLCGRTFGQMWLVPEYRCKASAGGRVISHGLTPYALRQVALLAELRAQLDAPASAARRRLASP